MSKTPPQLDREIAQAPANPFEASTPLYGHTNEATAYLVEDYPYGFKERTQIRYWLESSPKKGWRFVSQTLNPKTGKWNKPKASTYAEWGSAMYLDNKGHVQWEGLGPYSDEQRILTFVRSFPEAETTLQRVAPAKRLFLEKRLDGRIVMSVNGVGIPLSEYDIESLTRELAVWKEIESLLQ